MLVRWWTLVIAPLTLAIPSPEPDSRLLERSASCDGRFLYFNVLFDRPFGGLIYSDGEYGRPQCTFVNGSVPGQIATKYNISIPLDACRTQTWPNGTSRNVLILQRDPRVLEISDSMFVVSCRTPPEGSSGDNDGLDFSRNSRFTLNFAGVTVQGTLASTEVISNSAVGPGQGDRLDYAAEVRLGSGPFGQPLDRALGVGEPITYLVRLKKLAGSTDARIGRCWATDGQPTGDTEIQLSDDEGCSLLPGGNIWNNFRTADSDSDAKLFYTDIRAWAFPTSNRVNIFCNLHLCQSVCPPSNCRQTPADDRSDGGGGGDSNRTGIAKRTVDDGQPSEAPVARMQSGYRVLAQPFQSIDVNPDRSPTAEAEHGDGDRSIGQPDGVCLTRQNFVIGVVLLIVIILISLLFIVVLLCKISRHRRQHRKPQRCWSFRFCSVCDRRSDDDDSDSNYRRNHA